MKRLPAVALLVAAACAAGPPGPAALDTRAESCAFCRMAVSQARFAAQLVAPAEEPRFFDDLGCLAHYLSAARPLPPHALAYVADHRSGTWVRADAALYTLVASLETPMGSHLVAHADAASRAADPAARSGNPQSLPDVFGPGGPAASAP